jgi:hypothetical protein
MSSSFCYEKIIQAVIKTTLILNDKCQLSECIPFSNKKFLCNKMRLVDCEKQSLLEFKISIQGFGKLYHYHRKEDFF